MQICMRCEAGFKFEKLFQFICPDCEYDDEITIANEKYYQSRLLQEYWSVTPARKAEIKKELKEELGVEV